MTRYVEGEDRSQATLFPESLDEYIGADNPVRVVDVFVDELDLRKLGFESARFASSIKLRPTSRATWSPLTKSEPCSE